MEERLQKIIAQWGIASRRHAEEMILAGRVRVNGVVAHLGQKADPLRDQITIDGQVLSDQNRPTLIYLLLNKPLGVVSTCDDPEGRQTVIDILKTSMPDIQGIHPVGRLDVNSTGAILLTNDGNLTFQLTHPRHGIPKTYLVWVRGHPPQAVLQRWCEGVWLDGKKTLPAKIRVLEIASDETRLEIIIKEGRNRQIRRIAEQLGYPVNKLHRTAIGSIHLHPPGQLPLAKGQYRHLQDAEIKFLHNLINNTSVQEKATTQERQKRL